MIKKTKNMVNIQNLIRLIRIKNRMLIKDLVELKSYLCLLIGNLHKILNKLNKISFLNQEHFMIELCHLPVIKKFLTLINI